MRTVLLTLRPSRAARTDLSQLQKAVPRLVSLDLWPTDPRSLLGLAEGHRAFLHVSQRGVVGEATLRSGWREWTDDERRLLPGGVPSLDQPGGVELRDSDLWDEVIPTAAFSGRRLTNDVMTLYPHEVAALEFVRASLQPAWEPPVAAGIPPNAAWIVIDEVVEDSATLEISRWPTWDPHGIRFPSAPAFVRVDSRSLAELPTDGRPLAGRAFAASVHWEEVERFAQDDEAEARPSALQLLTSAPVDITQAGREAAQVAFFWAVTRSTATHEELERYMAPEDEESP